MLRFIVRKEMEEKGCNNFRDFDALSQEQFELWFKVCYEGELTKAYPDYK